MGSEGKHWPVATLSGNGHCWRQVKRNTAPVSLQRLPCEVIRSENGRRVKFSERVRGSALGVLTVSGFAVPILHHKWMAAIRGELHGIVGELASAPWAGVR